jgi:hypothetical protein
MAERPEPKETFWDSAKPYDWTKPKEKKDELATPLPAPTKPDATTETSK